MNLTTKQELTTQIQARLKRSLANPVLSDKKKLKILEKQVEYIFQSNPMDPASAAEIEAMLQECIEKTSFFKQMTPQLNAQIKRLSGLPFLRPYEKALDQLKNYIQNAKDPHLAQEVLSLLSDPAQQETLFLEKNIAQKTGLLSDNKYRILTHKILEYIEENKQVSGSKTLNGILRDLYHELPLFPNESPAVEPYFLPEDFFKEYDTPAFRDRQRVFNQAAPQSSRPIPEVKHNALKKMHRAAFETILEKYIAQGVDSQNALDLLDNAELVKDVQAYLDLQLKIPWKPEVPVHIKRQYCRQALKEALKVLNMSAQSSHPLLQGEDLNKFADILLIEKYRSRADRSLQYRPINPTLSSEPSSTGIRLKTFFEKGAQLALDKIKRKMSQRDLKATPLEPSFLPEDFFKEYDTPAFRDRQQAFNPLTPQSPIPESKYKGHKAAFEAILKKHIPQGVDSQNALDLLDNAQLVKDVQAYLDLQLNPSGKPDKSDPIKRQYCRQALKEALKVLNMSAQSSHPLLQGEDLNQFADILLIEKYRSRADRLYSNPYGYKYNQDKTPISPTLSPEPSQSSTGIFSSLKTFIQKRAQLDLDKTKLKGLQKDLKALTNELSKQLDKGIYPISEASFNALKQSLETLANALKKNKNQATVLTLLENRQNPEFQENAVKTITQALIVNLPPNSPKAEITRFLEKDFKSNLSQTLVSLESSSSKRSFR